MKLKRKLLAVITAAATVLSLCACSSESGYSNSDSGKLKIISTVFPPYDLARQIAGDNAEISILPLREARFITMSRPPRI